MKKNIWYALLAGASLRGMDQPPTRVTIGKDQLMALIKQSDAKRVLFACKHQNAAEVIDPEVVATARSSHTEQSKLSKSGSIVIMIEKHCLTVPNTEGEKALHKSHRHHSGKHHEPKPKDKLLSLIKRHDSATLEKEMGTSLVHFVDHEVLNAAESEYQILENELAKAKMIAGLLSKYIPKSERRKSCIIMRGNKEI